MAVTRKTTEELAANLRVHHLNRPTEDDFFQWPEEYYTALSKAHRKIHRKIAQHNQKVLVETSTLTTSDGGETYEIGDFHLGGFEVYAPPGPPTGERILPANPDSGHFGFWIDGTTLKLTVAKEYTALYTRAIPDTVEDLDPDSTHLLPGFCEDYLELEAAFIMASKPGFPGSKDDFRERATREWLGDPGDPSDMGLLGTLKRQNMNEGVENAVGMGETPWWRGIG